MRIEVHDSLQDYSYNLVAKEGEGFDAEFCPDLTPKQMLDLGVFGGNYFEGEHDEFPAFWFYDAKISSVHDVALNFFQVDASQTRDVWIKNGWMSEADPRGWFQWYCRYYLGRRLPAEDDRQIKRWKQIKRHAAQIKKYCHPGDLTCRRRQRQALLHWAYDSTKM